MDSKETDASSTDAPPLRQSHDNIPSDPCDQQGTLQAQTHPQPQWTQLFPPSPVARAMGSRLSLNSLTDPPRPARRCSLSVTACRHGDRARRFSCPRLERSNSKGYIKLTDLGGESFEAPDTDACLAGAKQEVATDAVEKDAQGEEDEDSATPSTFAES